MLKNKILVVFNLCLLLLLLITPVTSVVSSYGEPRACSRQSRPLLCKRILHENRAAVQLGQIENGRAQWGYINRSGQVVIAPRFDYVQPFSEGLAAVEDGHWGYIDQSGSWVLPPNYDSASPFNNQGTALVTALDGRVQLIDRSGAVQKTFPLGTRISYAAFGNGSDLAMLEVPIAPVIWDLRQGHALTPPEQVMEAGQPVNGWIPALKRTSQYGGDWGYLDATMQWVAKPADLQPIDYDPITDGAAILVNRDNKNVLLDPQGNVLVDHADNIEWVWSVVTMNDAIHLVDSHGQLLADLGTGSDVTVLKRTGDTAFARIVLAPDKIALIEPSGHLQVYDFGGADVEAYGHYLFVNQGSYNGPLLQVFGPQSKPILDQATIARLATGYSVYGLLGDHPAPSDRMVFIAIINPDDYKKPSYLLTSAGDLIKAVGWDSVDSNQAMAPAIVVNTADHQYGVIGTDGDWIVKPRYDDMTGFIDGIALARTRRAKGRVYEAVDMQGQAYDIPEAVQQSIKRWQGNALVFADKTNESGGVRYGLWGIREGKMLHEADIERIKAFNGTHALAKIDGVWGDIDLNGHWQPIPQIERASEAERHGVFYVIDQYVSASSTHVHALFSLKTGQMVATDLRSEPLIASDNRFVVQPMDGGTMLVDLQGNTVAKLERSIDGIVIGERFVILTTDHRYGAIDPKGNWVVPPIQQYSDQTLQRVQRVQQLERAENQAAQQPATSTDWETFRADGTDTYGFKNAAGEIVINARFDRIGFMHNGRAPAMMIRRYGEVWGYIDRSGRFVIKPQYEYALPFYNKRAFVGKGRSRAYIDPAGHVIARFVNRCGFIVAENEQGGQQWPDEPVRCKDAKLHEEERK